MNEPQELRSIDELFRNTFNNLPDAPADNGWDTPSDRVWQHVQTQIKPPTSGWSLNTILVLAGFAVVLVIGLFFATSSGPSEKTATQAAPVVSTPVEAIKPVENVLSPAVADQNNQALHQKPANKLTQRSSFGAPKVSTTAPSAQINRQMPEAEKPEMVQKARQLGAAPLPGSNTPESPNTTEALKAQHARQLEMLWNTPLELLPVPRNKSIKN
ncbi:MAG: hypothetical protein JNJ57_12335 [Saprospiraceae bacterium]|nr:hypothetical protein [Saprospiraceae bacterium]